MLSKKLTLGVSAVTLLAVLACGGCGASEEKAPPQEQEEASVVIDTDLADQAEERFKNLSEWNGKWRTFTDYCADETLDDAWETISDHVDIDVDKMKDTFEGLCFIADDIKVFDVHDGKITALDSQGNEVFTHEYELQTVFDADSEETVIEGGDSYLYKATEEAGRFNYICMMPICSLEENDKNLEMATHFHFNYGVDPETATDRSGIPSMVEEDISDDEKQETLLAFFLGNQED